MRKKGYILKYSSVLMMFVSFVRVLFGLSFMNYFAHANNLRLTTNFDRILAWATLGLIIIGGILELAAGIIGALNCEEPLLAGKCIKWGTATLICTVGANLLQIAQGYGASMVAWITGLIVPGLYFIGAIILKYKKTRNN